MKRSALRRLACIVLCLLLLAPNCAFAEDVSGVVNTDGVVLRERPGTNQNAVTLNGTRVILNRGDRVEIIPPAEPGEDGDPSSWYFVLYSFSGNYVTGYVRTDLVTTEGGGGPTPTDPSRASVALMGTQSAEIGDTVCLTLSVSAVTPIGAWLLEICYDENVLSYVSGADSALPGRLLFCNYGNGATSVTADLVFTAVGEGETVLTVTSPQIVSYDAMAEMETEDLSFPVTVVDPHEHSWGEVVYTWAEDHSSCTAVRPCTGCGQAERETASAEAVAVTPAACEAPGNATYTVVFFYELFETQTVTVETAPALGHAWSEATYTWSEDNGSCTALRTCARCGEKETETALSTVAETKPAAYWTPGEERYTAVFTDPAFAEQTKTAPTEGLILWGDVNGDGAVNNKDIVRLKNYIANFDEDSGVSTVEITVGADATGDGAVNNKDIVRLKNYIANYDEDAGLSTVILGPAA